MECQDCSGKMALVAGGTVMALWRCDGCGAQLMGPAPETPPETEAPKAGKAGWLRRILKR